MSWHRLASGDTIANEIVAFPEKVSLIGSSSSLSLRLKENKSIVIGSSDR
jgi:hypothetical protein